MYANVSVTKNIRLQFANITYSAYSEKNHAIEERTRHCTVARVCVQTWKGTWLFSFDNHSISKENLLTIPLCSKHIHTHVQSRLDVRVHTLLLGDMLLVFGAQSESS